MRRAEETPDNCDKEPVHIPGGIQPHGVLLVLRATDLVILQTSANCFDWLGTTPEALLGTPLFELVGVANAHGLCALVSHEDLSGHPRRVFSFAPERAGAAAAVLDVTAHLANGAVVLEMERAGAMDADQLRDAYRVLDGAVSRLQTAATLRDFCQAVTDEVAKLTGLDRVMVYRFAQDNSGWVFAETRRADLEAFLDFHYPAEDIPKPAREMFTKIWLRSVPDILCASSAMLPITDPQSGKQLDMTFCFLRGVSPMYAEYLKNMRVRMSLTMSIRREGRLWGLVACHHHIPKVIDHPLRAACELLAQVVSLQVKSIEDRENAAYKNRQDSGIELLRTRAVSQVALEPSGLVNGSPNLLDLIEAGGAVFQGEADCRVLGNVPADGDIRLLLEWLRNREPQAGETGVAPEVDAQIFSTDALGKLYPPAQAFQGVASGLLAVPVSRSGQEWLLWFRPETIQNLNWAGNPNLKSIVQTADGPALTPRRSFERWKETVRGRSLPWKSFEIEAARKLRIVILEMAIGRAEDALRDADKKKDVFIATLAHELRNPLAPISNAVSILRELQTADSRVKWCGDVIDRQVVQMSHLLEDLLDVSRIVSRKLVLDRRPLELAAVIENAIEVARPLVTKAGHTLTVDLPPGRLLLNGDPVRLTQIFSNLLTNAAKYTPNNGHIAITALSDGGEVVVAVKDDGIGLSPGQLAHVFELFSQVDTALKHSQGGLGIGLSLVKGLVEMHTGSVVGRSDGVGKGCEFVVRLPLSFEKLEQLADETTLISPSSTRYRVLVVDDNRDGADALAMALQLSGNDTETAYDGPDAVLKSQAFSPDVILLDIGLPDMDGNDTCRAIRRVRGGNDVAIIAITGWGQEEDKRNSREAGFDAHLVKPVIYAELVKLIASCLKARGEETIAAGVDRE